MLSTILVTASVSKTPFYIAGILLAIWAVVLAGLGLSRSTFPYSATGSRAVIGITFVLMVLAMAMAVHTSTFD